MRSRFLPCSPLLCTLLPLALASPALGQSGAILQEFAGQTYWEGFAGTLDGCGDIDGDGVPDLVIGDDTYAGFGGHVRAYSGATGAELWSWSGFAQGDAVAGAGDVDADGTPDIIVGDLFASLPIIKAGAAYVYSGATGALLHEFIGDTGDGYLGRSVDGVGDIDGDGAADLIIGADGVGNIRAFGGAAYVRSGLTGALLFQIDGTKDHGYLGSSVAGTGDTNGDGIGDFLVGAYGEDRWGYNTGAAYLYSGADASLLHSWTGLNQNNRFGEAVAATGDLDGDGSGDLAIAAPGAGPNGQVYLYSGATGQLLFTLEGQDPGEVFGKSVAGAGDVDGDGTSDVIVGSDRYYTPGGYSGIVRVFSGVDGHLLQYFTAGLEVGRLGLAVAGPGDLDGDGRADLLAGAPEVEVPGLNEAGVAYLFSGQREGVLLEVANLQAGGTATLRLYGADPTSSALFAYSLTGAGPTPTPYGDAELSAPIQSLPPVLCDANGMAEIQVSVPGSAAGVLLWAQAAELYAGGGGVLTQPLALEVH